MNQDNLLFFFWGGRFEFDTFMYIYVYTYLLDGQMMLH